MKKILVILTGGTIGSRVSENVVDLCEGSVYQLIDAYEKTYGKEEFEVINPFSTLSENMMPETWEKLCQVLWNTNFEQYRGVILAHGSDTLSYTAALLGMLFGRKTLMVLIASNYPIGERGSNGLSNLRGAVAFLKKPPCRCGAFVIYRDGSGKMPVYLSTRIREADPYGDQFTAFGGVPFGYMEEEFVPVISEKNPSCKELSENREAVFETCPDVTGRVIMLKAYPGLDYERISLQKRPHAVLHLMYHSATACTVGEEENFLRFLKKCKEQQIPVYIASVKDAGGRAYATGKQILEQGAIPLLNISPEAAYGKLLLQYGQKKERNLFRENLFYEHLPYPSAEG